jgi:hypothetical protein
MSMNSVEFMEAISSALSVSLPVDEYRQAMYIFRQGLKVGRVQEAVTTARDRIGTGICVTVEEMVDDLQKAMDD